MTFEKQATKRIAENGKNKKLISLGRKFFIESHRKKYSYNYYYFGRPIIQYPQDIVSMQEIIFETNPDLIIETGIAHVGSLIFYSSMLTLLISFKKKKRMLLGLDIEIKKKNYDSIKKHPFNKYIKMIEGDSIDAKIINKVKKITKNFKKILVILDSNHTYDHVKKELNSYAKLASKNSYCIVFDTIINDLPNELSKNRPWNKKNNPMIAAKEFLKENKNFKLEKKYQNKNLITCMPNGLLKRI